VDASRACDIKAMVEELKIIAKESKSKPAGADGV
jgi:hypothetical protein